MIWRDDSLEKTDAGKDWGQKERGMTENEVVGWYHLPNGHEFEQTLKLQYFGHLMQITDSLERTLILGKIEGGRRRGWQKMRWLDGITDLMDMSKLRELVMDRKPGMLQPMGHKESDMT